MSLNIRVMVAALAAVALSGAFYMLALKPKRDEASTLKVKIAKQEKALHEAERLLAANEQARGQYRAAYASVVRLGKAVPADDDVRSLLVQLDRAAHASKVDFRSINVDGATTGAADTSGATQAVQLPPGATVGPAGFPVMPFSFAFTGSFFNLGDFFGRLQGMVEEQRQQLAVKGRLLTLNGLQLQPDQTKGFPHIRATVKATSYLVSPLEGATGGATAEGPAGTGKAAKTGAAPGTSTTPAPATSGAAATSTGVIR